MKHRMTDTIDTPDHGTDAGAPQTALPPVEAILPHRGTMLLIEAVLSCDDHALTAEAGVHSDAWYADGDGAMPAWIGIELMAQTVASHISLLAMRAGGRARPGVLLGTRSYAALRPAFPAGARLVIEGRELLRGEEGHSAYECTIEHDGVRWAEAVIKVFQPTDFRHSSKGA